MNKKGLIFNNRDELFRFDVNKIVFIKAEGNYARVFTTDGNIKGILIGSNLAMVSKELEIFSKETKHYFIRIGRKHIVNLDYIFYISLHKKCMILTDFEKFQFKLDDVALDALKMLKERILKLKK